MQKKARLPSAKQRTISLFTGKTDLEDPRRARDGTLGAAMARIPRQRRLEWVNNETLSSWTVEDKNGLELYRIDVKEDAYHLFVRGKLLGSFASALEAARACEE